MGTFKLIAYLIRQVKLLPGKRDFLGLVWWYLKCAHKFQATRFQITKPERLGLAHAFLVLPHALNSCHMPTGMPIGCHMPIGPMDTQMKGTMSVFTQPIS